MRAAVEVIAEDGFEGASTRDMAARAGVSVAALYHHFPSKLGLLREFLDEAYAVTLARIERRLDGVEGAVARLENVVGTLVWTHVHDEFARRASVVAVREYTRLDPADRAAIEVQRKALLDLIEGIVRDGIRSKAFRTDEPREVARAIVSLTSSLVGVYAEIDRPLDDVIALVPAVRGQPRRCFGFATASLIAHRGGERRPSRRRRSRRAVARARARRCASMLAATRAWNDMRPVVAGHDVLGEVAAARRRASRAPSAARRARRRRATASGAVPHAAAFHSSGASSSIRSHSCSATRRPIAASSCERTAPREVRRRPGPCSRCPTAASSRRATSAARRDRPVRPPAPSYAATSWSIVPTPPTSSGAPNRHALTHNHARSSRGSPTWTSSQSIAAASPSSSTITLPSRRSPCTIVVAVRGGPVARRSHS